MAGEPGNEIPGTWLRGADGGLYFIPDADLESYRVPDDLAKPALNAIDNGDEVTGFASTAGGPPNLDVQPVAALYGPAGIRGLAAAPAIIPPPASLRGLRLLQ